MGREKRGRSRTRKVIPKRVTDNRLVGDEDRHLRLNFIKGDGVVYGKLRALGRQDDWSVPLRKS